MMLLLAITYIVLVAGCLCAFYFFSDVLNTSDKIAIVVPPVIAVIYSTLQWLYYRNEDRRYKKKEAFDDFDRRFRDLIEYKSNAGYEQKTDNLSWFRIPRIVIGEFRINPFSILRDNMYETKIGEMAFQGVAVSITDKTISLKNEGSFPPEVRYDWIDEQGKQNFDAAYESWFKELDSYFGHYFSSLCDLIRSVEKEPVFDKNNKEFCIRRLKHSLTSSETFCLFYYCLNTKPLCKELKRYVEKYGLFENLSFHCLEDKKMNAGGFYDTSAFGERIIKK
ncbi:MAG: hypothetical protein OXH57_12720 [Ekhidna sp.]|nr:hypothetical protein [Ekhidna sp.]